MAVPCNYDVLLKTTDVLWKILKFSQHGSPIFVFLAIASFSYSSPLFSLHSANQLKLVFLRFCSCIFAVVVINVSMFSHSTYTYRNISLNLAAV